jgi:hypothetical protein
MKADESYYPFMVQHETEIGASETGISIRDKFAHDYICALLSCGKQRNFDMDEVKLCYALADAVINYSNTEGK